MTRDPLEELEAKFSRLQDQQDKFRAEVQRAEEEIWGPIERREPLGLAACVVWLGFFCALIWIVAHWGPA